MTSENELTNDEPQPNYDIPEVIMDYVNDLLPEDEEWDDDMDDEDIEDEVARAFFVCVTAWNVSALPEDCAALYLAQVEESFAGSDGAEAWEDAREDVMAMATDMATRYPGGDHIIIDHELENLDDGSVGLAIDVIPIAEAIATLRETN